MLCAIGFRNDVMVMVGLVDCDNFFVSCERSVRPDLEGIPVVVLGNNDGCVVARSNEAKAMGIRMGVPVFEIRDLVDSGKVHAVPGNHTLYKYISGRVHSIFREYVPDAVDYSVDEAFLDVRGIPVEHLVEIGVSLRERTMRDMHIPVTVGFAATKVLAKLAVESIKKTPVHVRVLIDNAEIEEMLRSLPVNELWGIGRRLVKRMMSEGVYSAADFYHRPCTWIKSVLGVTGERLWLELHGESCITIAGHGRRLQDSISETRTFRSDTDDFYWIESQIASFTGDCARRLRKMKGVCGTVRVFLCSNRFRGDFFSAGTEVILPSPVSDTLSLTDAAMKGFRSIYKDGIRYKRGGVTFLNIFPAVASTPSLFGEMENRKSVSSLMRAVDLINVNGKNLRLASEM